MSSATTTPEASKDCLVVGVDSSVCSSRALTFAAERAARLDACLIVVYVVEWSPYAFQSAEENAQRHKRREQEIAAATSNVLEPALARIRDAGVEVDGMVRHGNVADVLLEVSKERGATQLFVGRVGEAGLKSLIFGSVTSKLVQVAPVPVTVVP